MNQLKMKSIPLPDGKMNSQNRSTEKDKFHGCRWTKRLNKKWILQLSYFVLKAAETAESAQSYAIKFIILNLIL